jgi:heat shock protein HslJ
MNGVLYPQQPAAQDLYSDNPQMLPLLMQLFGGQQQAQQVQQPEPQLMAGGPVDQSRPIPNPQWIVVDTQNNSVVGTYVNRSLARTKADNRNLDFGAHRYTVRPIR